MEDRSQSAEHAPLDVADRKMLAEIKESVLGTSQQDFLVGRFRVLERLGGGSMGVVFVAFDDQLKRRVALKLLHRGVGGSDDQRKARMLREAQVLAQLAHPNVVQVHEAGEHEGQIFMAMELVEGQPLDELQRGHSDGDWKKLLELYVAAGRGLAAAHGKGVVHRDFKPHNVVVDTEGGVRVVDFGLARGPTTSQAEHTAELPVVVGGAIERPQLERLTATGIVPGTPAYMAPELFEGQVATPQSDQFAFCVALYEAVYGRRPFDGSRLQDMVAAAKRGEILPPPSERSVPRWIFKAVARGLAPSPADRYPNMEGLLAELTRDRGRGRRRVLIAVVAVVVAGVAWAAGAQASSSPVIEPVSQDQARAAAEELRKQGCGTRVVGMQARWTAAKERLASPSAAANEADELAAISSAGAERFFHRWEESCRADLESAGESCRARSELALEGALTGDRPLHEDAFHDLTYELELCLEEGTSACGSSPSGSPAALALEAARSAELTGDLDAAAEHAGRATALATGPGDRLTRLRAMLRQGAILESRGQTRASRALLETTLVHALICDADVLAVDVALKQAESEAFHSGDPERAELALQVATELLAKNPTDLPLRRARLLEKIAASRLHLERRCAEGLDLLAQALALRERAIIERAGQGLSTAVLERLAADAQLNIANTHLHSLMGYWEGCDGEGLDGSRVLEEYRQARERFATAAASEGHLGLAAFDFSYGAALLQLGQPLAAAERFELALTNYEAHHGPMSLLAGDAHRALAAANLGAGALEQARHHAAANVDIRVHHEGEEGQRLSLAEAHDALGVVTYELGLLDTARESLSRAIQALSPAPEAEITLKELEQLRLSYVNLALVEWDRDDRAAARSAIRRARELQESPSATRNGLQTDLAPQLLIEARLMLADGQRREALDHLAGAEDLPGAGPAITTAIAAARESATALK